MLEGIAVMLAMHVMGLAIQAVFYAVVAYWVAKMARKGWRAGK